MKRYRKLAQKYIDQSGHDISLNQLILLINLKESPNYSQVQLAEILFKDFASVVRMVDILVKKGYLTRTENPKDRRKKDLTPTPQTNQMIEELIPVINEYRQVALQGFSPAELTQLATLLDKFIQNCDEA